MLLQNIIDSKYYYQPNWVMVIIVLSLLLIGYLYSAFHSRFITFIKAVFLSRYSVQSSREERSLSHPVSLILSMNFLLSSSLFVLQLFSSGTIFHSEIEFSILSFLIIALAIFSIYLVKIVFLKIFAFMINKQELISEYIFTIILMNQFLGIALIPVIIFIAYGPKLFTNAFIVVGAVLFLVALLLRIGKGIGAVLDRGEATLFYLILYLCTLEILPLLVGIKLFEKLA